MSKEIKVLQVRAGDVKNRFGNPRKIGKKKLEDLKLSMKTYGDFGIFVIDENMDVIAGNMRLSIVKEENPDTIITCKQLIGYTEAEKRAINIKDNTHAGEWDLDLLADWTADLNLDLGLDEDKDPNEKQIKEMELIHFEKYDYVLIVCKSELDYLDLTRKLGIDPEAKVKINEKKKIKGRAIWYDKSNLAK